MQLEAGPNGNFARGEVPPRCGAAQEAGIPIREKAMKMTWQLVTLDTFPGGGSGDRVKEEWSVTLCVEQEP